MKYYTKTINENFVIKAKREITVIKNGLQIINPSEDVLFEDGWEEYVIPATSDKEKLEIERKNKLQQIIDYDTSSEVNVFYIKDFAIWLDKNTRTGLKLRFEAELAQGKETTTLWYEGISFDLTLEQAMQMLYLIELYASECYDNTQKHIANVKNLNTIDEIRIYDYTLNYPEKLKL